MFWFCKRKYLFLPFGFFATSIYSSQKTLICQKKNKNAETKMVQLCNAAPELLGSCSEGASYSAMKERLHYVSPLIMHLPPSIRVWHYVPLGTFSSLIAQLFLYTNGKTYWVHIRYFGSLLSLKISRSFPSPMSMICFLLLSFLPGQYLFYWRPPEQGN